jgi:hypothetical protein
MSQYPSPYTPPPWQMNYGYNAQPQDLSRNSRRASTLMFILGGLILLLGSCNAISSLVVPAEVALQRQREMFPTNSPMPFSAETMKAISVGSAVVMMLVGAGLVSLGTGVRRGGRGSTVTALVLGSILLVFLGLVTLLSLLAGLAVPLLFSVSCVAGPAAAMVGLLVFWLIGAMRASANWSAAQQQYQAQYWQYQQNMQQYGIPPAPPNTPAQPGAGNEPPRT